MAIYANTDTLIERARVLIVAPGDDPPDDNAPDDGPSELEREAMALLDRMAGDPDARRRYAAVAERAGWPCYGLSWHEWAEQVTTI